MFTSLSKLDVLIGSNENPHPVGRAGEYLEGKILIELQKPKKLNTILLAIYGAAHTSFIKHGFYYDKNGTRFHDDITYINCCLDLENYVNNFADKELNKGTHEIPFKIPLPSHLPTSFEGKYGYIRYTLTVTLKRDWKWDHILKRDLTVIGQDDLSQHPELLYPFHREVSKTLTNWFSRKCGDVIVTINIPKLGYVPGESIFISCDIINNSEKHIDRVCARLVQYLTFKGQAWIYGDGYKEMSTEVACFEDDRTIDAGQIGTWRNVALKIPPIPPRLINCNIIILNYAICFEIDKSKYIEIGIPIAVGTRPIYTHQQQEQRRQRYHQPPQPIQPTAPTTPDISPPPYPEESPPTYRECVTGQISVEADDQIGSAIAAQMLDEKKKQKEELKLKGIEQQHQADTGGTTTSGAAIVVEREDSFSPFYPYYCYDA